MIQRIKERIIKHIVDTEDCIEGYPLNSNGYVDLQIRENGIKLHFLGHRVSYEIYNNITLVSKDIILHTCDNPSCINPKHLVKGTHNSNIQDKVNKGRQAKGKQNGMYRTGYYSKYDPVEKPKAPLKSFTEVFGRKLTKEQVLEVRVYLKENKFTIKEIGFKLQISINTIKDIKYNKSYKNVR